MKPALFLLLTLLVFPSFATAQKSKYIGYKFKPVLMEQTLSNGVKDLGGSLITEVDARPTYAIGRYSKGKTQMLWLELATGEDENGVTGWEVKDVLAFPNFRKNQELLFGVGVTGCEGNESSDTRLIVLADFPTKGSFYKVRRAWRANLKTEKFEETSIKGIRCEVYEP